MQCIVDTNILLYAANRDCGEHASAREFLEGRLDARSPFSLTWGIVYEFLRVSTHPRVFPNPLAATDAVEFIREMASASSVSVLTPTERHWDLLQQTLSELTHPCGNLFHDIGTAVLAREHGVREVVTADTDFLQFRFLRVNNPISAA